MCKDEKHTLSNGKSENEDDTQSENENLDAMEGSESKSTSSRPYPHGISHHQR